MAKAPSFFKLERAVWDANGVRIDEGSIVEMSADDALEAVESGAIKRATDDEVKAYKAWKAEKAEAEAAEAAAAKEAADKAAAVAGKIAAAVAPR